ncbi:MAG: hypothetical protein IM541_03385 [Chitinophagaceae bacterium]|nr:hypothetical protein [Chitinophagaceae bacterium]
MNPLQEKALYHLTGQLENNERAGAALEKAVSSYPYFAPAQNLLACYYQATQHPSATTQAARATLYHFNPRWWAYQLEESREEADEWTSPVFSIPSQDQDQFKDVENNPTLIGIPQDDVVVPKDPIAIPTVEAVQAILRKIDGGSEENLESKDSSVAQSPVTPTGIPDKAPDKLSSMLSSQLEAFRQPVTSNTPLPFEQSGPMHTVDYFASQGIKVNWQTEAKDNLTKKMMSFTDWLKQVKQNEKSGTVTQLEKKVAEDAVNSVRREEVVTEAMAEVLLRQGHREQAIQLFKKLSFQIPEKSSYFAIRIEQIKSTL